MDALRGENPIKTNAKNDIIFQCLEWIGTNEMKQELNPDVTSHKKFVRNRKHVVKLYGVTKEGVSVSVNNNEFDFPVGFPFYIIFSNETVEQAMLRFPSENIEYFMAAPLSGLSIE